MTSLIRKLLMLFTVILPITTCEQAAQRLTEIAPSDFIGYDHPSADRQKFSKDRYACYREASGAAARKAARLPKCGVWTSCLTAKGYTAVRNGGRLKASPSEMLQCRQY